MLTITMKNSGGVLETLQARNANQAAEMARYMVMEAGELHAGDVIEVTGHEEGDEADD